LNNLPRQLVVKKQKRNKFSSYLSPQFLLYKKRFQMSSENKNGSLKSFVVLWFYQVLWFSLK